MWTARFRLIAVFVADLGFAIILKLTNRRARPQRYVINDPVRRHWHRGPC